MLHKKKLAFVILLLFLGARGSFAGPEGSVYGVRRLSLDEVLSRLLQDHTSIRKALIGVAKAQELKKAGTAGAFPEITADAYSAFATGETQGLVYSDVTLRLPLFSGGKYREERRLRDEEIELQKLRVEEARLLLALEVRKMYYGLLEEKELIRLARDLSIELREHAESMRLLFEREAITKLELLGAESLLAWSKHSLVEHKEKSDYWLSVLKRLLELGEDVRIEFLPVTGLPEPPYLSAEEFDSALTQSPSLRMGEHTVRARKHEEKILKATRWPEISFSSRYNRDRDVFVDTNRFMVGLEGRMTLWDFGRTAHEIRAKAYEVEEARLELKLEAERKEQQIRRLLAAMRTLHEEIRLRKAEMIEHREAYRNDRAALTAGEKGKTGALPAALNLYGAQERYLKVVTAYRVRYAEFLYETGISS